MLEWLLKKVLCSKVNDLLRKYKSNVDAAKDTIKKWILRIQRIMACLEGLLAKLDDGEITSDEVKEATGEVTNLIKEW